MKEASQQQVVEHVRSRRGQSRSSHRAVRVGHLVPYLGRARGGPVMSVRTLADGLVRKGCRITVAGVEQPDDGPRATFDERVGVMVSDRSLGGMFRWCPSLSRALSERGFDVVHSHGLWTYVSIVASRVAARRNIPHVLAPCGMLQEKALRRSSWKKRICRWTFQDKVLKGAACLHVKSDAEYEGVRGFGLTNPVAVIPNPVAFPADLDEVDPDVFRRRYVALQGKKILLYLGRLHPVKGLARLVEAWASLWPRERDWHLVLAGPDEDGYKASLVSQIESCGCQASITFTGPLNDEEKWTAYRAADLFVMPSDFENFGCAIVEAMMAGVPVVTTTGTPWKALRDQECGWWVDPSTYVLAEALAQAMAMPSPHLHEKGETCRQLVKGLDPAQVAEHWLEVYRWLLGRGERPGCVRLA